MKNLRKICEHLDAPELLAQLAEEAGELTQAALKLRRAITGVNPTPTPLNSLIYVLKYIIDLAGYDLLNRIEVKDRRTGKEYR